MLSVDAGFVICAGRNIIIVMQQLRFGILYALTISVAVIAVRVEYLNAKLGYYLPRTDPRDAGTWRSRHLNEDRWRHYYGPRDESGTPLYRELTSDKRRQMQYDIAREDTNDRLRSWVSTAGLLQYLLLPCLVVAAIVATASKWSKTRLFAMLPVFVVIVLASASLWYRSYFSSLER